MATTGPDIHFDYGYTYPIRVDSDASLVLTGKTVIFRVGVPGPVAGVIAAPLIELTLTVAGPHTALGTVPAIDTAELEPGVVYGYHVQIVEDGWLVSTGRAFCRPAVGS